MESDGMREGCSQACDVNIVHIQCIKCPKPDPTLKKTNSMRTVRLLSVQDEAERSLGSINLGQRRRGKSWEQTEVSDMLSHRSAGVSLLQPQGCRRVK